MKICKKTTIESRFPSRASGFGNQSIEVTQRLISEMKLDSFNIKVVLLCQTAILMWYYFQTNMIWYRLVLDCSLLLCGDSTDLNPFRLKNSFWSHFYHLLIHSCLKISILYGTVTVDKECRNQQRTSLTPPPPMLIEECTRFRLCFKLFIVKYALLLYLSYYCYFISCHDLNMDKYACFLFFYKCLKLQVKFEFHYDQLIFTELLLFALFM